MIREAACACGQLRAVCRGEPGRISVCHCHDCQRRSGSAFSAQARWPVAAVEITGEAYTFERVGDSGHWGRFRFCPTCGSTIAYQIEAMPGQIAVPLGAFADDTFPPPAFSVYENRQTSWLAVTGDVHHD